MKICVLPLLLCLSFPAIAQDGFVRDLKIKWENARAYTVEVAEAMPARHYGYKPTEVQRTFSEQLVHITGNMVWLSTSYLDGEGFDGDLDNPPDNKEDLIKLVNEGFIYTQKTISALQMEDLEETVQFFAGPMTKRQICVLLNDHVTHHRGQLIVYLRLNSIEPPRYRGW